MKILRAPFYPFLVALHPVLALLAANLGQARIAEAARISIGVLLAMGLVMLGMCVIARDRGVAAFRSALLGLAFLSYGHVYHAMRSVSGPEFILARHRGLLPFFAAVLLAGFLWSRTSRDWSGLTRTFNLAVLLAFAVPIVQITVFQAQLLLASGAESLEGIVPSGGSRSTRPDVYLIILDAYTRDDVLDDVFGVNNQPFLDELESLGFDVFACSTSNYSQTELTLASLLNATYLEDLPIRISDEKQSRTELLFLIRQNRVRRAFEQSGYRIYAFETGYPWSEWESADVYLRPGGSGGLRFNGLEVLFLDGTAMRVAADARFALPAVFGAWREDPLRNHRERIEYALDQLPATAGEPGPKLVFAHLVIPHRPYLFSPPDGWAESEGYLDPNDQPDALRGYEIGYRNQVLYLDHVFPQVLREIQANTDGPLAVLVMGDHGADEAPPEQRMAILHALLLPGTQRSGPDENMTPINSIRLIVQAALGADLPMLENRSLYSSYDYPFDFQPIEPGCSP